MPDETVRDRLAKAAWRSVGLDHSHASLQPPPERAAGGSVGLINLGNSCYMVCDVTLRLFSLFVFSWDSQAGLLVCCASSSLPYHTIPQHSSHTTTEHRFGATIALNLIRIATRLCIIGVNEACCRVPSTVAGCVASTVLYEHAAGFC